MRFSREDIEVYKHLLVLIAYQIANITMILGFFIALFLIFDSFGLF